MRPYVLSRPPSMLPHDKVGGSNDNDSEPAGESTNTTPECPTQPPYVAIATQQQNNTAKPSTESTNQNSNITSVITANSDRSNSSFGGFPVGWTFTNMLIVIVSTGSALLMLNLMVIICFCNLRKRTGDGSSGNRSHPHSTLPRMDSAATAMTQGSTSASRFEVETEKTAAFKQMMVEVSTTDGRRMTSSSAESVSSVIDLTRMRLQHQNHLQSVDRCETPPTTLPLATAPCRPAISLGSLAPQPSTE